MYRGSSEVLKTFKEIFLFHWILLFAIKLKWYIMVPVDEQYHVYKCKYVFVDSEQ